MKITVTKEDIEQGRRHHPSHCPIGRAVGRSGLPHYCVTRSAILIGGSSSRATALLLPEPIQHWILAFDEARPVQPVSFELGLPVPVGCPCPHPGVPGLPRCTDSRTRAGLVAANCPLPDPRHDGS